MCPEQLHNLLTSDVALVVMLLQQSAVVGELLVFVWLSQEVGPRGRAAAILRQRPARAHREMGSTHPESERRIYLIPIGVCLMLRTCGCKKTT